MIRFDEYNIIASDCTGGYLYNILNKPYENPFIWTNLLIDDFVYIVENYDKIDFHNYDVGYDTNAWHSQMPVNSYVTYVRIDNAFNLYFTHHLYSDSGPDRFIRGNNRLISNNMLDRVADLYAKRINRMIEINKEPIFIYLDWSNSCCDIKK